ncbi:MAG: hypothetical protein EBU66_07955 [Bacteroidetes bacterium]|jgi:hypothetical protein|nr:hypothetical protein [bacterium]NBP64581.1 hypothetical protein [Bacteroidota bacterium]
MWPDAVKTVYVLCHPTKEKDRYDRLIPHLLQIGIPKERIKICAPTWGADLTVEQIFSVYNPYLNRGTTPAFTFKAAGLSRGEISLGMNFYSAVQDAAKSDGLVLTLESDVWLREDFVQRLADLLADATTKWDYISLGEGVGTRAPGAPISYYAPTKAYKPPHQWVFRCTDSMLFTTEYMKRLEKTFVPFKEIIDWEMNYQLMLHKGIALWADPPLAEQGTCNSRLVTSLPA